MRDYLKEFTDLRTKQSNTLQGKDLQTKAKLNTEFKTKAYQIYDSLVDDLNFTIKQISKVKFPLLTSSEIENRKLGEMQKQSAILLKNMKLSKEQILNELYEASKRGETDYISHYSEMILSDETKSEAHHDLKTKLSDILNMHFANTKLPALEDEKRTLKFQQNFFNEIKNSFDVTGVNNFSDYSKSFGNDSVFS